MERAPLLTHASLANVGGGAAVITTKSRAGPQWPFAYDGLLAFWLVAIEFFLWMVVMSVVMLQVLARDERRIKPAN